jgi:hypothetical protein
MLDDALERTGTIIGAIGPDLYGRSSRCAGWTVEELLSDLIATIDKFTWYARGNTTAPRTAAPSPEQVCHAAYLAVADASSNAWKSATGLPPCTTTATTAAPATVTT